MSKVTFRPAGDVATGDLQDTVLEVALDNDIDIDHNCGGNCSCTTCAVLVERGMELLSVMATEEQERLEENDKLSPSIRLACQSRIIGDGDIVVTLHG